MLGETSTLLTRKESVPGYSLSVTLLARSNVASVPYDPHTIDTARSIVLSPSTIVSVPVLAPVISQYITMGSLGKPLANIVEIQSDAMTIAAVICFIFCNIMVWFS